MYNLELINIALILLIIVDIFVAREDNVFNRKITLMHTSILLIVSVFNIFNMYYGTGSEYFVLFKHLAYILIAFATLMMILKHYDFPNKKIKTQLMLFYSSIYTFVIIMFSVFDVWSKWTSTLDAYIINPIGFATILPFIYLLVDSIVHNKKYDRSLWVCLLIPILTFTLSYFVYSLNIFTVSFTFVFLFVVLKSRRQCIKYDSLTNLLNRYSLDSFIKNFNSDNKRRFIYFIDLNKFKQINDSFGHLKGDKILVDVAKILSNITRPKEYLFRYGGDEFIVISNYDFDTRNFEKELKSEFENYSKMNNIQLEASLGVSEFFNKVQIMNAMDMADKNMYANKKTQNND